MSIPTNRAKQVRQGDTLSASAWNRLVRQANAKDVGPKSAVTQFQRLQSRIAPYIDPVVAILEDAAERGDVVELREMLQSDRYPPVYTARKFQADNNPEVTFGIVIRKSVPADREALLEVNGLHFFANVDSSYGYGYGLGGEGQGYPTYTENTDEAYGYGYDDYGEDPLQIGEVVGPKHNSLKLWRDKPGYIFMGERPESVDGSIVQRVFESSKGIGKTIGQTGTPEYITVDDITFVQGIDCWDGESEFKVFNLFSDEVVPGLDISFEWDCRRKRWHVRDIECPPE